MAADNELRLISRAIRTRDITVILEYGLKEDWFYVDENRSVWKFILNHWSKYQEVPTAVTVKDNFPTYRLLNVEDSIEYLLDQLVEYRRRQKAIEIIQDAADSIAEGDHASAIATMSSGIAKIADEGVGSSRDVNLTSEPLNRYDEYLAVKTRPNGLIGMATGFSLIDQATAGLQPGQLVVIIAPPKTGKSVVALQTAVNLHNDGFVPMFQSFEMSSHEQQTRHDAMRSNISHARLTRGALKVDEEVRYQKMLKKMETMHNFYLTDGPAADTISGLAAKIEKIQPDVVFVDGVYLMTDEVSGEANTAKALTNITRSLKKLAQKIEKPIVITTQVLEWKMKKNRVSASSIGYSSSFFQDADVILALERQDEEDDSSRLFRIEASRNCGKVEMELLWDWENGKFQEY